MARVPYIQRDDLPESQQPIFDQISNTRGSGVSNVFAALLNSPGAAKAVISIGEYIKNQSHLDPIIRETAILSAAKELNSEYQWAQHESLAKDVGVRPEVIESIRSGKGPMGLPAKEGIFIQSAKELVKNSTLTDRTYQALDHLLGAQLTIDFIVTVGYYVMLARIISSLDITID
tara:strand:+ start:371 stop:895 length:525 start_codon:yes stop_codon:yes gene_type:complete